MCVDNSEQSIKEGLPLEATDIIAAFRFSVLRRFDDPWDFRLCGAKEPWYRFL